MHFGYHKCWQSKVSKVGHPIVSDIYARYIFQVISGVIKLDSKLTNSKKFILKFTQRTFNFIKLSTCYKLKYSFDVNHKI